MTADADKPAKTRAERTLKVQESLRVLHDAHTQARGGLHALGQAVASLGGPEAARHAELVDALTGLQAAYERVVEGCRAQGVPAGG